MFLLVGVAFPLPDTGNDIATQSRRGCRKRTRQVCDSVCMVPTCQKARHSEVKGPSFIPVSLIELKVIL